MYRLSTHDFVIYRDAIMRFLEEEGDGNVLRTRKIKEIGCTEVTHLSVKKVKKRCYPEGKIKKDVIVEARFKVREMTDKYFNDYDSDDYVLSLYMSQPFEFVSQTFIIRMRVYKDKGYRIPKAAVWTEEEGNKGLNPQCPEGKYRQHTIS